MATYTHKVFTVWLVSIYIKTDILSIKLLYLSHNLYKTKEKLDEDGSFCFYFLFFRWLNLLVYFRSIFVFIDIYCFVSYSYMHAYVIKLNLCLNFKFAFQILKFSFYGYCDCCVCTNYNWLSRFFVFSLFRFDLKVSNHSQMNKFH